MKSYNTLILTLFFIAFGYWVRNVIANWICKLVTPRKIASAAKQGTRSCFVSFDQGTEYPLLAPKQEVLNLNIFLFAFLSWITQKQCEGD